MWWRNKNIEPKPIQKEEEKKSIYGEITEEVIHLMFILRAFFPDRYTYYSDNVLASVII